MTRPSFEHLIDDAIYSDDADLARRAMAEGLALDAPYDAYALGPGHTPLVAACRQNAVAVATVLLDAGAALEGRDLRGNTPLIATRNRTLLKVLLARGADVHAANDQGRSALMENAGWWTNSSAEAVKILLDAGASKTARDEAGKTALDIARSMKNPGSSGDVRRDIVIALAGKPKLDDVLAAVSAELLGGEPVPELLRALHQEDVAKAETLLTPMGEVELLRGAEDVASDPTIGRDGPAGFRKFFERVAVFAREADGGVLGFWRHGDQVRIAEAPILYLDNEGELEVMAPTFADFLVMQAHHRGEEPKKAIKKVHAWLKKRGVVGRSPADIEKELGAFPDPKERLAALG